MALLVLFVIAGFFVAVLRARRRGRTDSAPPTTVWLVDPAARRAGFGPRRRHR